MKEPNVGRKRKSKESLNRKRLETQERIEREKREAEQKKLEAQERIEREKREAQENLEREKREFEQKRLESEERMMKEKREAEREKREAEERMAKEKREAEERIEREKREAEDERAREQRKHELDLKRLEGEQTTSQRRQESSVKTPKLPTFCDGKDDLDAYLGRFERYAETHAWDKGTWALNLSALLTGRALEVYSRLSNENAKDYDVLKKALQDRYHLNAEGFRMKLRESVAVEGESPAQFIERLKSYLGKWIELAGVEKTYEGLEYLILAEQFTSTCNKNLATFLKERDINSLKELGEGANKFLQAHGKQMKEVSQDSIDRESVSGENESQKPRKVVCWDCGEEGHRQSECKSQGRKKEVPRERSWGEVKCYNCGKMGHIARNCRSEEQRSYKGGAVETVGESEVKKAGVCVKMGVKDTGEGKCT